MLKPNIIRKSSEFPRGNLTFTCAYELDHFLLDPVLEIAFFSRGNRADQLWVFTDQFDEHYRYWRSQGIRPIDSVLSLKPWLAVSLETVGTQETAAFRLLGIRLQECGYECAPGTFVEPGLLLSAAYEHLRLCLGAARKATALSAAATPSPIIKAAQNLKLNPRPSGKEQKLWLANCPTTNHHLRLDTSSDTFSCGYCRRGGDRHELERFTSDRWGRTR